ncbi:hypothetical protein D3C79_606040 [compost metagenome]
MAIARRFDLTAGQVNRRYFDLSLRFTQLPACHRSVDLGVLAQLGADRLWPQGDTPRRFMLAQAQLMLAGLSHRVGLFEGSFKAITIDRHEQLTRFDLLVVVHLELADPA